MPQSWDRYKIRLGLDVDPELHERIDRIAGEQNSSKADILRQAFRVYEYLLTKQAGGAEFIIRSPYGEESAQPPISLPFFNSATIPRSPKIPKEPEPLVPSTIVDYAGRPIRPGTKPYSLIIEDVRTVSDQLLQHLHSNPAHFYELEPRRFEEVIAELLHRQGYNVSLTPSSKDGGVDLFIASRTSVGSFLYLVECKRYSRSNPVGVEIVRQLYGVVEQVNATAGIIATTSVFTSGAREWQRSVHNRMDLRDFHAVQEWLRTSLRVHDGNMQAPNSAPAADV